MIYFEINGRKVQPNNIQDVLEKAILQSIESQIRQKIGSIRDPKIGEFPIIVCKGKNLDNLSFSVEGSPEMIALVHEKLGSNGNEESAEKIVTSPIVFLSYASEDADLAKQIAHALQTNGIETWWDKWCINGGESLRQKIEEGLEKCTHFIVLLTSKSITKSWVNAEIDAGFTKKLEKECRFIPLRYDLNVSFLSPFLKTLYSPEISDLDKDISQLINDIYGINRKPPLGAAPKLVQEAKKLDFPYSPAAMAIAKVVVERSENGMFNDPRLSKKELQELAVLSDEDMKNGLQELSNYFYLKIENSRIYPYNEFFSEFDSFWKPWNPKEDALRLVTDMVNNNNKDFSVRASEIAKLYGWNARRINPAIIYLKKQELIETSKIMNGEPWVSLQIKSTPTTRSFVKTL